MLLDRKSITIWQNRFMIMIATSKAYLYFALIRSFEKWWNQNTEEIDFFFKVTPNYLTFKLNKIILLLKYSFKTKIGMKRRSKCLVCKRILWKRHLPLQIITDFWRNFSFEFWLKKWKKILYSSLSSDFSSFFSKRNMYWSLHQPKMTGQLFSHFFMYIAVMQ